MLCFRPIRQPLFRLRLDWTSFFLFHANQGWLNPDGLDLLAAGSEMLLAKVPSAPMRPGTGVRSLLCCRSSGRSVVESDDIGRPFFAFGFGMPANSLAR